MDRQENKKSSNEIKYYDFDETNSNRSSISKKSEKIVTKEQLNFAYVTDPVIYVNSNPDMKQIMNNKLV